jgi:glutathione S-transferase
MDYEFFYWPEIQGRGEFVRLALEDAGAAYVDVARDLEGQGHGVPAMLALMRGEGTSHVPFFAPPFRPWPTLSVQLSGGNHVSTYLG